MASFLNICLQIPNLGTIAFMIIFVFAIPTILFYGQMLSVMQVYAPFVVMLASTCTQAGKPDMFQELYQIDPRTPVSFMTANLINLFGLISLLWYAISISLYRNNQELGIAIATIIYIVTFPVSRQAIPFMIEKGDKMLKENTTFIYPYNWHKFAIGIMVMLSLLSLQYILVSILIENS